MALADSPLENLSRRHLSAILFLWLALLLAFAGSPAVAHINGIAKVSSLSSNTLRAPIYTPANVSTTPVDIKATVTDSVNQSITVTINDTTVTYYHNDALGSPIAATNAAGALLWRETYRPYGERLDNPAAAATNPIWFTGKRQDPETGLVYMGARYYNPALGRFLGIDPVEPDENNLHSLNRYAYANNNPYKFTDPDGQAAETVIDVISLGLSIKTFRQDPGFINGLAVAYDGFATAVPFLPGGLGIIRQAATKGGDVTQAIKQAADRGAAKAGEGAQKAAAKGAKKVDVGSPTAGKPVDSNTRERILARDQNPDGTWTCATCGQKTANPANVHTGHIKARSHGGDLSDANLRCEGAACNLSQGNRSAPSPNMTCAARGSCGAPYGRSD